MRVRKRQKKRTETILRERRRQDSTEVGRRIEHTKRVEAEGVLVACRQLIKCHWQASRWGERVTRVLVRWATANNAASFLDAAVLTPLSACCKRQKWTECSIHLPFMGCNLKKTKNSHDILNKELTVTKGSILKVDIFDTTNHQTNICLRFRSHV